MPIRFANCRLDIDARRLFRGTREVHLSPKAFEALTLLVDNRSRAISKTELLERVWPGVFVSEASLAKVVNEIREAVGDRARRALIVRTVHGYGYAFAAEVEVDESGATGTVPPVRPHCWLVCGTREFALADGEHVVGRNPEVSVWLESPKVSRHHARLIVRGSRATIEDLGSKNGTYVRRARISGPTELELGDEIRIGRFTLIFRVEETAGPTETDIVTRAD
jgi:DNA-binding winged helix-turn-helix (wHTH) protein